MILCRLDVQQTDGFRRVKIKMVKKNIKRFRLSVFRSSKHIYAQIIDDQEKKTLLESSDLDRETKKKNGLTKTQIAEQVGVILGEKATEKKINTVFFDRGKFRYHGRVKALAEGARKAGLGF